MCRLIVAVVALMLSTGMRAQDLPEKPQPNFDMVQVDVNYPTSERSGGGHNGCRNLHIAEMEAPGRCTASGSRRRRRD